eukprot:gb/GECG01000893.1/.p1 GENE.gb/GECG01000893.1/~~gb/GECG01000893.1/.p1  ORF type:complete len:144 (+),score=14.01 gb/GECG01000893.1/:1-432(+)
MRVMNYTAVYTAKKSWKVLKPQWFSRHYAAGGTTAHSLAEAYQLRHNVTNLELKGHSDLMCQNLMCEKVGLACACRLALRVTQIPQLKHLDVSDNGLDVLPDAVFDLANLETLRLRGMYSLQQRGHHFCSVPQRFKVTFFLLL